MACGVSLFLVSSLPSFLHFLFPYYFLSFSLSLFLSPFLLLSCFIPSFPPQCHCDRFSEYPTPFRPLFCLSVCLLYTVIVLVQASPVECPGLQLLKFLPRLPGRLSLHTRQLDPAKLARHRSHLVSCLLAVCVFYNEHGLDEGPHQDQPARVGHEPHRLQPCQPAPVSGSSSQPDAAE